MFWNVQKRTFDLSQRSLLMGVLNATPDSFSDGGRWAGVDAIVKEGVAMVAAGADLLDIGGESSRPGATNVSIEEELRRVLPVLESLASKTNTILSIDTCKPTVAEAALKSGASVVNDITGLRNAEMRRVIKETGAGAIAMHMQGTPQTMQQAPTYQNVVSDVRAFLSETLALCRADRIDEDCLLLDPGIGFGKTVAHNLELLRNLESFKSVGRPLALGVSRKSFLGSLIGNAEMSERSWPTIALTSFAASKGVALIRVHEVRENTEALKMSEAIHRGKCS